MFSEYSLGGAVNVLEAFVSLKVPNWTSVTTTSDFNLIVKLTVDSRWCQETLI
jgi:hypothetical protein